MDIFQTLGVLSTQFPGGETLYAVFVFLIVLGLLVFFHEWGHYRAAKSVGICIEEFAIGFGKPLFRWTDKEGTSWKIGLIPLGGYVRMKGQEDGKPVDSAPVDSDSFAAKSLWQRSWVVIAGPLANFVLAMVVFMGLFTVVGEYKMRPEVGGLQENMPAAEAGLHVGDTIKAVNDTAISTWDELQTLVSASADQPVQFIVERNGQMLPVTIIPELVQFTDLLGDEHQVGRIGVLASNEKFIVEYGFFDGLLKGVTQTWDITALTLTSVYKLIIGAVSPENLAGPLGIADMASQSATHGTYALLLFLAIISINLGIVNLLPIPVLDGGHLVFFLIEGLKGSPVSERAQLWALRVGITLIFILVVFSTSNDIQRLDIVKNWRQPEGVEQAK